MVVETLKKPTRVTPRVRSHHPIPIKDRFSKETFGDVEDGNRNAGSLIINHHHAVRVVHAGKGVRVFF